MKKLIVMLLGIFLVVSLVGCGGGGKKDNDDEKGVAMDSATRGTRYEEVSAVGEGLSMVQGYLSDIMSLSGSSVFRSMAEEADDDDDYEEEPLEWDPTRDNDGWYTAVRSHTDEGWSCTVTYKMRYIAKTSTIELHNTYEETGTDVETGPFTYSETVFISTFMGANNLWNGQITTDEKDSEEGNHTYKVKYENLDPTNGAGTFTIWVDGSLAAEIIITPVGSDNVHVTGKSYQDGEAKPVDQTLSIDDDSEGGDVIPPGEED